MQTRDVPPSRKSILASGDVKPVGPHQRITCSGSLQALHTSSTGAPKTRVTTTLNVLVPSSLSLSFMFATPFQSALFVPTSHAVDTRRCETADGSPNSTGTRWIELSSIRPALMYFHIHFLDSRDRGVCAASTRARNFSRMRLNSS